MAMHQAAQTSLFVQIPTDMYFPALLASTFIERERKLENWYLRDAKYILSYTGEEIEKHHQQLGCSQTTHNAYFGER